MKTVADWILAGNEVKELPLGFSGELSKGWNSSSKNMSKVLEVEKKATLTQVRSVQKWCNFKKGRAKEVCQAMGVAHGFLSQIFSGVRPCSVSRYEEIKEAMKIVEGKEVIL